MSDCKACNDLRENAPDFVANGVTTAVCNSLKNDTGLDATNGNNNCTDMDDAINCLIGNMEDEIERYDTCTWMDFTKQLIVNLTVVLNAINCSMCGIWINIHNIWADIARIWAAIRALQLDVQGIKVRLDAAENKIINILSRLSIVENKITKVSYVGILTLERSSKITGNGSTEQSPAFDTNTREGNIPNSVLTVASDYKGIVVNNTLSVPILVDTTFNCAVDTDQHFASCYILVRRGSNAIGQTPFITPDTYDQQVMAKPFVLNPGQTATMRYAFRIGVANAWFQNEFGYKSGGSGEPKCVLAATVPGDARVQGSYFSVKVTSIVS